MRYGNQPLSEIESMTIDEISMWADEIGHLIELENGTGSRADEDDDG
jgi:hypothetical protein